MASRLLTCAVVVAAVLGTAAPAVAQEDGPTVDPSSPSGKEYALPLENARQNGGADEHATSKPKTSAGSEEAAPLFGVGVGDDRTTTAAAKPAPKADGTPAHTTRTTAVRTTPLTTTTDAPTQTTAVASAAASDGGDGGGGADGTLALIVVGVLAAGLLAGAGLRWQAGRTAGTGAPRRG